MQGVATLTTWEEECQAPDKQVQYSRREVNHMLQTTLCRARADQVSYSIRTCLFVSVQDEKLQLYRCAFASCGDQVSSGTCQDRQSQGQQRTCVFEDPSDVRHNGVCVFNVFCFIEAPVIAPVSNPLQFDVSVKEESSQS